MGKIVNIPSKKEMQQALELRHTKQVQDCLTRARVAICGLGGLGSNIAIALARCGVGHLHLIDFDEVDLTNLNRQQYQIQSLGRPKTDALKEIISQIAPYADVSTTYQKITRQNVSELLKNERYICEAFDVPEQKAMLTNAVLEKLPECYLVGASGMAGYATGNTIQTRKITSHYYLCGDGESEITKQWGLMAPRVMICAGHQANTIIELIIEHGGN